MKVVNMGNISDAFRFDNLPATGIVIEATPEELKLLPNLAYKDVTISEHVGNSAKMREALNETQSVIAKCMDILNRIPDGVEYDGLIDEVADELCDLRDSHVKSALSASHRNCDRPECATSKAAQEVWRKEDGGKTAYYEWLLATYTEGGTTDGKKH